MVGDADTVDWSMRDMKSRVRSVCVSGEKTDQERRSGLCWLIQPLCELNTLQEVPYRLEQTLQPTKCSNIGRKSCLTV